MSKLKSTDVDLLLTMGAGIKYRAGKLVIFRDFRVSGQKATYAARRLIKELASSIASHPDLQCDFIATFAERPAVVELAQQLASELSKLWNHEVGVLAVARYGREVEFMYHLPTSNGQWEMFNISRLRTQEAHRFLAEKKTLLFTDVLRGERHEGIIRMLVAGSVRRSKVKVVGLAALVVKNGGIRYLLRRTSDKRNVKTMFLLHLREREGEHQNTPTERQKTAMLTRVIARLFRRNPRAAL